MSSGSSNSDSTFKIWFKSHFDGVGETTASLIVVIILVPLGIIGIFGSKFIDDNIVSILCTVLSVATIFLYQLWRNQRKLRDVARTATADLQDLVLAKSPFNVSSRRISGELMEMLANAKTWSFRGGSGRWQRACVLPYLARERNRDVLYRMLILDPTQADLCDEYADYRNKHRVDAIASTAETVRSDLIACIVACAWYSKNARIIPEVHLAQTYSPLRQDMSDKMAAITVADLSQNGLFVPTSSWYHESLMDEFNQLCGRSPRIYFTNVARFSPDWKNLTTQDVKLVLQTSYLKGLNGAKTPLDQIVNLTQRELEEVRGLVFKGRAE